MCQNVSDARLKGFKSILGPWLLAGIIFSYGFQGENIKEFTKPVQVNPLDTFDEIVANNYTIYSPPDDFFISLMQDNIGPSNDLFRLADPFPVFQTVFDMQISNHYDVRKKKHYVNMINSISKPTNEKDLNDAILDTTNYFMTKLMRCDRTAYVDGILNLAELEGKILLPSKNQRSDVHLSSKPYAAMHVHNFKL